MNRNAFSLIASLVLLSTVAASPVPTHAAAPQRALILFNPPSKPISPEVGGARMIANLLTHFSITSDIRPATAYAPGLGSKYRAIYYLQIDPKAVPPAALVDDLPKLKNTVCWLGGGLEAVHPERYGLKPLSYDGHSPAEHVRYQGRILTRMETEFYSFQVTDPKHTRVMGTAVSPSGEQPWAAHNGNFWYFGDSGVLGAAEEDRALAFADLMHDMLDIQHPAEHRAMIRIEDVSVDSDPKQLRKIADVFGDRHVPFAVALIPVYKNPHKNIYLPMTARPEFVDAIHYMMSRGATIIMHGGTHQYHGVSADDAEFFNQEQSTPIVEDSVQYVENHLGKGLRECLLAGTPPVAWETPHYRASQLDYHAFSKVFGTSVEQKMVCDDVDYDQCFPFYLPKDLDGQQEIPENLGYVPHDDPGHVEDLIKYAGSHLVVRDGWVGCFFHPFLDTTRLARLVDGIKAQGYEFIDIKRMSNHRVTLNDLAVRTGKGSLTIPLKAELLHEYYVDDSGHRQRDKWSERWVTGKASVTYDCPEGWIYVAEGRQTRSDVVVPQAPSVKPQNWFQKLISFVAPPAATPVNHTPQAPPRGRPRGAIVWSDTAQGPALHSQRAYENAFAAIATKLERLSPRDVAARLARHDLNLLVVPSSTAPTLPADARDGLVSFVREGGNLITEGKSPLADGLGVKFDTGEIKVKAAQELETLDRKIEWQHPATGPVMMAPPNSQIFTRDRDSHNPLVIGGELGEGHYVVAALPFDTQTDLGVTHFPYLTHDAFRHFNLQPSLSMSRIHAFYDPDIHFEHDPDRLAEMWRSSGIRAIHVSAWKTYRHGKLYNYDRLIEACHSRGIAVYAWVELPMADATFYYAHPEWREVSADGLPVAGRNKIWRYLMAMEDPACEAALLDWTKSLLQRHSWDGVDLAELYFECNLIGDRSAVSPMHPSARARFAKVAGFDPKELINPKSPHYWATHPADWKKFENWRVDEVTRLHSDTLRAISEIRNASGQPLDVIVTAHDSDAMPNIRRDTGVDTKRIVGLLKEHDFSLQIEDPLKLWSTDPRRYLAIGARYRKMLTPEQAERLMLDINVMNLPGQRQGGRTMFPTIKQTGVELDELLSSAAQVVRRFTIYAEGNIWPDDWAFASSAVAGSQGTVEGGRGNWHTVLNHTATMNVDLDDQFLLLDGKPWPVEGDGGVLLPAGDHQLSIQHGSVPGWTSPIRITGATVDLLSADSVTDGLEIRYTAAAPGSVSLTSVPYGVLIDGQPWQFSRNADDAAVMCPAGEHTLTVVQEEPLRWRLDATSFYGSTLIAVTAAGAIVLLGILYGSVRRRRREDN